MQRNAPFAIDVVSDVVCPWCYIGKRRLEAALASVAAADPSFAPVVRWHPFQLNPELPREGVDRKRYLEAKFGGPANAAQIYARVKAAGESAGLALAFDRIERQPNTLDAHRLVAWAQSRRDADELVERLFAAYFVEGRAIGERDVLASIAGEAGFDREAAKAFLAGNDLAGEVEEADRRARELGIGGVPFFIFDGRIAVSGAHEPEVLRGAIAQALSTEPAPLDPR
jgi:predicted DsbA family dithiol-disulfide isomerase